MKMEGFEKLTRWMDPELEFGIDDQLSYSQNQSAYFILILQGEDRC